MKKAFTLVEMLVVVGIIATLVGASIAGFTSIVNKAQESKAQELVHEAATALTAVLQKEDAWPRTILSTGSSGNGEMDETVGAALARRGAMSLTYKTTTDDQGTTRYVLTGLDQCGIVSPWAQDVVKRLAARGSVALSAKVPSGGTIQDHRLRFAIDDDLDGFVNANPEGYGSVKVRASAIVWCAGRDGKFGTKDDIRSWSKGQEE